MVYRCSVLSLSENILPSREGKGTGHYFLLKCIFFSLVYSRQRKNGLKVNFKTVKSFINLYLQTLQTIL